MVLSSKCVPEFLDSEWSNVLAGKAVNLDAVFSGMYSTVTDNRAIENIGDLELHFGAAKPAKTVETHGDWVIAWSIVFKATRFAFLHCKTELEGYNDYITSCLSTRLPIQKSSTLIKPSENMSALSTMSRLTSLASFDTWKLAIFKATALVIVVLPLRTKLSQKMDLCPGGKLTLAVYRMRANVRIKPPHVSTGTSVNCAVEHITRFLALILVRSLLTFSRVGYARYACEQIRRTSKHLPRCLYGSCNKVWYRGLHTVCRLSIKPPRHMLGAAKK
jgi:hypothetical protein